jgi:uncharacterized protein YxeA
MKKVMLAVLAMALFVPAMAFAQSDQNTDQSDKHAQQQANQSAETSEMGSSTMPVHHMTGLVSSDGTQLTSDDTVYRVKNPGALKQYVNQNVTVKFQFDTDNNAIHIASVSPAQ